MYVSMYDPSFKYWQFQNLIYFGTRQITESEKTAKEKY
jgi:hypothetical protein